MYQFVKSIALSLMTLAVVTPASAGSDSPPAYAVQVISPPDGFFVATAIKVNDPGSAVISASDSAGNTAFFLWSATEGFRPIRAPDGAHISDVTALNNHGVVAGLTDSGAFYYSERLGPMPIVTPKGYDNPRPSDVNDKDRTVGTVTEASSGKGQIFTWTPSGGMSVRSTAQSAQGISINDSGDIFGNLFSESEGRQATYWNGPERLKLGAIGVGVKSSAVDVNNRDAAAVQGIEDNGVMRTYFWTADRGFVMVDSRPSQAVGIDSIGEIVGMEGASAFYWKKKFGLSFIRDMLVAGSPSMHNLTVLSISETGIVGGGANDDAGRFNAVVLSPVR